MYLYLLANANCCGRIRLSDWVQRHCLSKPFIIKWCFSPGWFLHLFIKFLSGMISLLRFHITQKVYWTLFDSFLSLQFIFCQQEQSNIWTAPGLCWLVDSWLCELVIGWWQWGGTLESDDWWLVLPRLAAAKMYVAILFLCVRVCVCVVWKYLRAWQPNQRVFLGKYLRERGMCVSHFHNWLASTSTCFCAFTRMQI